VSISPWDADHSKALSLQETEGDPKRAVHEIRVNGNRG